jgi:transcriptional regulator with XRE-family HTH domain
MNGESRNRFSEAHPDIAGWRAYRGISRRELAASSGISLQTITDIETGKRKARPSTLRRIAKALDTEVWNLGNDAGEIDGTIAEVARVLASLSAIASMYSESGGIGLAAEFERLGQGMFIDLAAATGWAEAVLLLMIPFWLQARRYLASEMSPEGVQNDARLLAGALPDIVREWARRGMPPEVSDALLRAELHTITMAAAEPIRDQVQGLQADTE